jgi:hypothetical protein
LRILTASSSQREMFRRSHWQLDNSLVPDPARKPCSLADPARGRGHGCLALGRQVEGGRIGLVYNMGRSSVQVHKLRVYIRRQQGDQEADSVNCSTLHTGTSPHISLSTYSQTTCCQQEYTPRPTSKNWVNAVSSGYWTEMLACTGGSYLTFLFCTPSTFRANPRCSILLHGTTAPTKPYSCPLHGKTVCVTCCSSAGECEREKLCTECMCARRVAATYKAYRDACPIV